MRVMLLGSPGAGKGTQAKKISDSLHIPQISTGDILRAAVHDRTPVGLKAKAIMDAGRLVSDEIILELVKARVVQSDCQQGYLFDGVPRTLAQAEGLKQAGIGIDVIIDIQVPDDYILQRLTGRRVHQRSGRTYHLVYNPPVVEGKDDVTGEPLIQRDDDKTTTVLARLQVYAEQTKPLQDYYKNQAVKYCEINGLGRVEEVYERIMQALQ